MSSQPETEKTPLQFPYADVAVDAYGNAEEALTYAVPVSLPLQVGHLVRVPYGTRQARGVVVGLSHELRAPYAKDVLGLVHPEPLLTPQQVDLASWISGRWRAPLFDAIALFLPPGIRTRTRSLLRVVEEAREPDDLPPMAQRLLAYLRQHPQAGRISTLTRHLGRWTQRAARTLTDAGLLVSRIEEPTFRAPTRKVQHARFIDETHLQEFALDAAVKAPRQAALARALLSHGASSTPAATLRARFGGGALRRLVELGHVELFDVQPTQRESAGGPVEPALLPTPVQAEALRAISAALDDRTLLPRTFLLHGVTGSGKTEVYLQALAHCLDAGKNAMVLVPELSLTPQTVARFEARFPGQVIELHSGLTPARQWEHWWRAFRGQGCVVIGSRSALFAPLQNVGLIVLDEEHEWTYKQQDMEPRYHARDVALELGRRSGAVVVLGSATPSVATMYESQSGRLQRLALPSRIERSGADTHLPQVEIVDMREELRSGNRSIFSRSLASALLDCMTNGDQAILFLNRRGAAAVVECRSCGFVLRCPRCAAAYTLHTSGERPNGELVCHHCNHRRGMASTCPDCGSQSIRHLGLGTQAVVDELAKLVPAAKVLRWDRDTASSVKAHGALLTEFASRRADILVGTQMIAKGLDIPSVTLVGAVLADVGLHAPDFMGGERTFQVLTQVAGRAGRGGGPGRGIIQTYTPTHYAIRAAANQDYAAFYREELAHRRAQANPPFNRLVRLVFSDSDPSAAEAAAVRLADALRDAIEGWGVTRTTVIGPAPTYPPKVRRAWRWQLLIRGQDPGALLDRVRLPSGWAVDVDPITTV